MTKIRTSNPLGTYYLGATVADPRILQLVRHSRILALNALGVQDDEESLHECHITIIPPFHTTYEEASKINLRCAMATCMTDHFLLTTQFSLGKMMSLIFGESSSLCFYVYTKDKKADFDSYIQAARKSVINCKHFKWRTLPPSIITPHITILNLQDIPKSRKVGTLASLPLPWNPQVRALVEKHNTTTRSIDFLVTYPTLYAKYGDRWEPLRERPTARRGE